MIRGERRGSAAKLDMLGAWSSFKPPMWTVVVLAVTMMMSSDHLGHRLVGKGLHAVHLHQIGWVPICAGDLPSAASALQQYCTDPSGLLAGSQLVPVHAVLCCMECTPAAQDHPRGGSCISY
jgi:hypothetical protein